MTGTWRALGIVFRKEFFENLRDRRTVLAGLLLGPLLGPLLFGFIMQLTVQRSDRLFDAPVTLQVVHPERAPNLLAFLAARGITAATVDVDDAGARQLLRTRAARVVLSIPAEYAARLEKGEPASLQLYVDASNNDNQRYVRRVRVALAQYASELATLRLALRGVPQSVLAPVIVQDRDVSTPASRSLVLLGMLSFFMIMSMLSGGMYLAIDSTAGERERGTLEPLLTVPVDRAALIYGKVLATCAYMLLALVLTASMFALRMRSVGLETLGMSTNLDVRGVLHMVGVTLPLLPVGAALLTILAAFTRSYREAQAWLGFAMLVPTLPLMFVNMLELAPSPLLMAIPSLGQHFLIQAYLRAEALPASYMAISVGCTLALGVVLMAIAGRLYRREALLG